MLGEVFYWIFNMSIVAAICGVPVLLIRLIKKIPRRYTVLLWLIPIIRMCIPVGVTGKYGLMSLISKFTTKTVTIGTICGADSRSTSGAFTMTNCIMGANSYFPITYKVNILEKLFSVASVIWIIVAGALLLAFFIIYTVTVKELNGAEEFRDNVYFSEKIKTPAVYGIIKPKIVLPFEYKERRLDYILMHEKAHVKRCDNLFRIFALAVVCVHWFNPLCWLFLKLLYTDMELACDETVVSKCDDRQRKEYAHALVSSLEKTNVFVSSFGGVGVRLRIENILSYKKLSAVSLVGFSALFTAIAYILLTNAA